MYVVGCLGVVLPPPSLPTSFHLRIPVFSIEVNSIQYAGVISATGTGYSKSWRVGDRICGFTIGGHIPHPEDGAFAEQILVKADVQMRVPDEMSFEDAATLGVGIFTCGQGLVAEMGLRRPRMAGRPENGSGGKDEMVLIYGGSTATGSLGVQFAAL